MHKVSETIIAIALLIAAGSGCRSEAVQDLRGREAIITPNVAVIWSHGPGMEVVEINGRAVDPQAASKFVILPGKTHVFAYSTHIAGIGGGNSNGAVGAAFGPGTMRIDFETVAGHEYRVGYPALWIGSHAYVEDLTTKQKLEEILVRGEPVKTKPERATAPAPANP